MCVTVPKVNQRLGKRKEGGREMGKTEGKEKKMGGEVSAEMNVMCDRVPYIILT